MKPDFTRNHFELLGLPVSYAVDAAALDRAYRDLYEEHMTTSERHGEANTALVKA